jgi:hypothetical protein
MRLLVAVDGTDSDCDRCSKSSGFSADLYTNFYMGSKNNQWREVTNWQFRANGMYDDKHTEKGSEFKMQQGRFYPAETGHYLCSANIRFDSFSGSYTKMHIGINGQKNQGTNGMGVIIGNGRSTSYYSMAVSGNIELKKGEYASVWIYGSGDNSYYIQSESKFSCHKFEGLSKGGFRADLTTAISMKTGWKQITGWETDSAKALGLYNIKPLTKTGKLGFDPKTGVLTPQTKGVYYCSAQVRLDSANVRGNFRMSIRHGDDNDENNGLFVISGNYFSTDYGSLQLAGTIKITKSVSLWIYSSSDNSYTVQHDSGFGCHYLEEQNVGFHADQSTSQTYGRYWQQIRSWRTSGNDELYASSSLTSNGDWRVPTTGFYFCSASVRISNMYYNGYSRLFISVDGSTNTDEGLNTITGNRGSTNDRFMTVSGTIKLKADSTVAVKVYSYHDNSWQLRSESGFGCHMLGVTTNNLLTNFEERINNGFSVIEGDGGSHNYRNMGVSGVVKMKKDQHASVFLYAHSDNNWQIQSESGFSCHKLAEKEGFHADKDGDSELGTN